jgi:hypothetical protein
LEEQVVVRLNVIHASSVGVGLCALASLAFPSVLLTGLGVPDQTLALLGVARLAGVLLLALAAVLWSARFWLLSPAGAPTLRILCVIHAMSAIMLLAQQVQAGNALESAIPILFLSLLAIDFAAAARQHAGSFHARA